MKADEKRTINADALLADAIALREKSERQCEEVERLRGRTSFIESTTYDKGYDRALRDVVEWIDRHSVSMKMFKMYNAKRIRQLLVCFRDNSDRLRALADELEIRVTDDGVEVDE